MAWYKFWKSYESAAWCYVEADSFEEARKEALRSEWDEDESYCSSACVAKAEPKEGEVVDPDDDYFDDWFDDMHELYDTRSLKFREGEGID